MEFNFYTIWIKIIIRIWVQNSRLCL